MTQQRAYLPTSRAAGLVVRRKIGGYDREHGD